MTKRKKIIAIISIVALLLVVLVIYTFYSNTAIELNSYTITSDKLPKEFSGYKIAQVSDLHNAEMGDDNEKLLELLRKADPDIIAITGDFIDSRKTNTEVSLQFAKNALEIAPCYYVAGNHEARIAEYADFKADLSELGVIVLEDKRITLKKDEAEITLIGVNDPRFETDYLLGDSDSVMKSKLQSLTDDDDNFKILLSHRPELFEVYADNKIDLVLSGHAHGGQVRLPFIGGLVAPNQGLFPKYDSGLYSNGNTNMIVSKGIGNSIIPLRINNNPEVILIELS